MEATTTVYTVLIQTAPGSSYQGLANWPAVYGSRGTAEASAARARELWHDAKVAEATMAEATALGWFRPAEARPSDTRPSIDDIIS